MKKEYRQWAQDTLIKVREKMKWVSDNNKYKIPYTTDGSGIYDNKADRSKEFRADDGINWWTNGFFAGMLWLLYLDTGDSKYMEYAKLQEKMLEPSFEMYRGLHHDVGFMFIPSAEANYRITGDEKALNMALHAANLLAGRFNIKGNFIRAWNDLEDCDTRGYAIIDCMFNISLLFFAGKQSKDPRYLHMARAHATTVMENFVRENGSVCHIVEFDPETGKRIKSHKGQGYAHGSSWTRGQGWGIYGFANAYRNCREKAFLGTSEKIADYCISRIGDDFVIPVDFDQPGEPFYEDSCGALVIAGGLLNLAELIDNPDKKDKYEETAFNIIRFIGENRADYSKACEAIVRNCSADYHNSNHNETMVYADYFFMEGLYNLSGSSFKMW